MKLYKLTDPRFHQDKYVLVVDTPKGLHIQGPSTVAPRLYRRWVSFDETYLTMEVGGSTWITIHFRYEPDGSLKSESIAPLIKEYDTVLQHGVAGLRMDEWNEQLQEWTIDLPKPSISVWNGDNFQAVEVIQR